MSDPSLALQGALIARLKAFGAIAELVGPRVFDKPPTSSTPVHPYVSLGPEETVPDNDACGEQYECWVQIDSWSRKPGRVEAKQMNGAVLAALATPLEIPGFRVVVQNVERNSTRPQPDGLTTLGFVSAYWSIVPTN